MVSEAEFRKCMSRFATGVTVVTTLDDAYKVHGMSANSFSSVCLDPPLLLICVAHTSHTYRYVERGGCFGVNILSSEQEDIGKYFAKPPEERHGEARHDYWITDICGVPALNDVLAFFGCEVVAGYAHGDHTIYIAEVKELHHSESGQPLLYFESQWYTDPGLSRH